MMGEPPFDRGPHVRVTELGDVTVTWGDSGASGTFGPDEVVPLK